MTNDINQVKNEVKQIKSDCISFISEIKEQKLEIIKIKDESKINFEQIRNEINGLKKKSNDEYKKIIKVPYNNSTNKFNGILTQLGNGNAVNSLENNIISISASSVYSSDQPKNVLNYKNDKQIFQSNNEIDSWLCIDFKKNKVNPSHYTIKSHGYGGKGDCHPQSWDIEGSNDQIIFDTLDIRKNQTVLDGNSLSYTFEIQHGSLSNKYYRYIRIRQTDTNTNNSRYFVFSAIEFFGNILKE